MNIPKLKEVIKEKGLTIHKLALQAELSYSTVYDIVHGNNTNPKLETIIRIVNTLDVDLSSILKGEEFNEKNHLENQKKENQI